MADYTVYIVLLAGVAFIAGAALTLIVSEHATGARVRHQAERERDLAQLRSSLDDRMALLSGVDHSHRGG